MARPPSSLGLLALAGLLLTSPALAQFDRIFQDEPPRPPANVPNAPSNAQPGYYPSQQYPSRQQYPDREYRTQQYPSQQYPSRQYPYDTSDRNDRPRADVPPAQPLPAPMSLPPQSRPGRGRIESHDLAPPPGTAPKQQANAPAQTQPSQSTPRQPDTLSPLPGLPPGQRQPRGTPQPSNTAPPSNEVVVEPPPQRIKNPTAVFAGLDKITGRITSFHVGINETVQFGALQVTPRVCYSRPPTETPQTDAFVEVDEVTLDGKIERIFTGWMFAASPGLHAVEHPIYDVWLTDCKGGKNPAVADVSADDKASSKGPPSKRRSRQ
jgi:hypothetical protein